MLVEARRDGKGTNLCPAGGDYSVYTQPPQTTHTKANETEVGQENRGPAILGTIGKEETAPVGERTTGHKGGRGLPRHLWTPEGEPIHRAPSHKCLCIADTFKSRGEQELPCKRRSHQIRAVLDRRRKGPQEEVGIGTGKTRPHRTDPDVESNPHQDKIPG